MTSGRYTARELERMLDWYRTVRRYHDVGRGDDELADKIALELAGRRSRSAPAAAEQRS